MGVKSTVDLTRQEAIEKYADLKVRLTDPRRTYMAEALVMDRVALEDALEDLNDRAAGGEGFENYIVRD